MFEPHYEAKRHACELKQPKWSSDGTFGYICRLNGYLVVCPYEVKFKKYARTMEGRGEVLNMRNRVAIGDGDVIEAPVVPTGAPVPRNLLGYHVEW